MINQDFIKNIFNSKPKKGSPFIFLYSEKKYQWRFVNAVLWTNEVRTPQGENTDILKTHPFYIAKPTSYGFLFCYLLTHFIKALIHYLHTGIVIFYSLKFCFFWIIFLFLRWYVKVRRMSTSPYFYTPIVWKNTLMGTFLFIISEIMIFFALFWAYLHSSLNPTYSIGAVWPPVGLTVLEWWRWPTLSTVILLYSGFTVNVFYYAVKTINVMSLRKAKNQIKSMRKSIENDKSYPSIFVEKNFSFEIFDENLSLKKYIKIANSLSFLKTIKKEVKKIEKRWTIKKKKLAYELRQYAYIEQKWGLVYYRVRWMRKYKRNKFYSFKVVKSWLYCAAAIQFFEWRLRYVFGGLFTTIIAGFSFLACQRYEYSHAQFDMTDGIYGTVFYSLTGLHGIHVFVGVVFLIFMFTRFYTSRKDFTRNFHPHTGFTSAVWYWHFVDIVWICVYLIVYVWGSVSYFHEITVIKFHHNPANFIFIRLWIMVYF